MVEPFPPECPFCRIASGEAEAVVLHEDDDLVAFLDIAPIRPGHTQIIPRKHVETFELLDRALATRITLLAQRLAARMKDVFGVDRVAYLYTGGDVPHVHAHLVPMHEPTDITSARYLVAEGSIEWRSAHLRASSESLRTVRDRLRT